MLRRTARAVMCFVLALFVAAQGCAVAEAGAGTRRLLVNGAWIDEADGSTVRLVAFPASITDGEAYRLRLDKQCEYILAHDAVLMVPEDCPIYNVQLKQLASAAEFVAFYRSVTDMLETAEWMVQPPRKGEDIKHSIYCNLYTATIEDGVITRLEYEVLP